MDVERLAVLGLLALLRWGNYSNDQHGIGNLRNDHTYILVDDRRTAHSA